MYDLRRSGNLCFTNWPATIKIKTEMDVKTNNVFINEACIIHVKKIQVHSHQTYLTLNSVRNLQITPDHIYSIPWFFNSSFDELKRLNPKITCRITVNESMHE